jgi:hypothetical protein
MKLLLRDPREKTKAPYVHIKTANLPDPDMVQLNFQIRAT